MKFVFPLLAAALISTLCQTPAAAIDIIAHRGASHDAPENTVAAFKLAWEQGADGAECDLYLTKDKKIVAFHDKTLKRTCGIDKPISDFTLEELKKLEVGSWKNEAFRGEKIPTFEEIMAAVPKGKKVYIEVKTGPEIVPELLRQLATFSHAPENTPVICFNAKVIAAVKKARPDLPAYFLADPTKITADEVIATARKINADGLDLRAAPELDKAYADAVHVAGYRLDVWTVNKPEEALRVVQLGVKGITTDRPAYLREVLAGRKPE